MLKTVAINDATTTSQKALVRNLTATRANTTHPCRYLVAAHHRVLSEHARHEREDGVEAEVLLDDGRQVLGVGKHLWRGAAAARVEALQLVVQQLLLGRVHGQVVECEQCRVGRLKHTTNTHARHNQPGNTHVTQETYHQLMTYLHHTI